MTTFRTRPAVTGRAERDGRAAGDPAPRPPDHRLLRIFGRHAAPREPPSATSGRWFMLAWLLAFVILTANATGRTIFDTKLGVDIDPAGFYARLWHLWNPQEWFGTLQDQYIGYAIPMAPFYLAGQLLHLPVWITERLWLSLLIALGFWGMVRLTTSLRVGSQSSRLLAGAIYALWPTFTIVLGSTSAAVLPGILVPWALLPLVTGAARGSVLSAAARSGAVVLCMGGVNAVSTIDALVLPALYIVTHTRGRRRVSLGLWWSAAVAAATSWWMIPLLIQNGYSFNFLPYVEQAATTTKTMSATAFLRGTGNWTAYFNLGGPWLSAGWDIVTTPLAVLATALAAAVGLAGLARRDMPEARWLRLSVALAALVALAGYWGPLGGVFHTPVLNLLNGAFAPFRNVYKLEPVIAVAVTLGLAHAAGRGWQRRITVPGMPHQIASGLATAPVTAFVLAGLALPYLSGQILQPGSFTGVPRYWYHAADFLAAHAHDAPSLVVPADAHGTYLWGNPIDDPLEPLARSPWVERGLVPYGGAGSAMMLITAEHAIESGEQVTGLATYLQRAGIRYVVVRNDLNPATVGYTPPQVVHETLSLSGFRRVTGFGPLITGRQTDPHAPPQIRNVLPSYQAVEIYEAASGPQQPNGPATVLPLSQSTLVNGGPDSLLQLAGQDLLGTQPVIMAGDAAGTQPSRWLVTDGMRRADNAFGLINSNASYTYTATERNPPDDPFGGAGGQPRQLLPVTFGGQRSQQSQLSHQTVAVFSGAAGVTASSYGSWLAEAPQDDPANAFDGDASTAWTEGDPNTPTGQWIQITFKQPLDLPGSVGIRLLDDSSLRAIADLVQVATAAGQVSTAVAPSNNTQQVQVAPGRTGWLRVTITRAQRVTPGGAGAGIRDVLIPGVRVTRYLQPPETAPSGLTSPIAYSFHRQVPSPSTLASPAADPPLARTFTTPGPQTLSVAGSALALPGAALDAALDQLAPAEKSVLNVTASSTWGSLPQFGPANLFSAVNGTAWVSGSPNPVIHLSWRGNRRIDRMVLSPAFGISAAPDSVLVTSPNGTREANIGTDGVVQFVPALTTDRIDMTFPQIESLETVNTYTGQLVPLTVGLSRLQIPALNGLRVAVPDSATRFKLTCGQGPGLTIDGKSYQTAVSGTVGELTQFLPLHLTLCTPNGTLDLGQGRHWLTASAAGLFTATDVSLSAEPAATAAAGSTRSASAGAGARVIDVFSWQPEKRQLGIGPGPASYLEVHENANPGWAATLDGRQLKPVRLDGWQQGFVVPAGQGGIITLEFAPATLYHVALVLAALGVIALPAVAIRGERRRRHRQRALPAGSSAGTNWGRFAGSGGWATQSWGWFGDTGAGSRTGTGTRPGGAAGWVAPLALTALIFVIGGPVALAVPVLAILARRSPRWLSLLAFVGIVVAGVIAATAPQPTALGSGAFSAPAQICALVALAAVLTPQVSGPALRRLPGHGGPGDQGRHHRGGGHRSRSHRGRGRGDRGQSDRGGGDPGRGDRDQGDRGRGRGRGDHGLADRGCTDLGWGENR
jgi:arabinofuranan 3-O-arabinosyltransferase